MEKIPYQMIRSRRRTLGLELRPEGWWSVRPSGPRTDGSNILWNSTASGSGSTRKSWNGRSGRRRRFPR